MSVLDEARSRGVTRLCHITASRHLLSILRIGAVLPIGDLEERSAPAHRNDPSSIPGWEDAISCTVEYPNAWYWRSIKDRHPNYADWLVLLIDLDVLDGHGVGFCQRNAASSAQIGMGLEAFRAIYSPSVVGSRGLTFTRSPSRLSASPTDDQAEVLIRGGVATAKVHGVVVLNEAQAATERARLDVAGWVSDDIRWIICPEFFQPRKLSTMIASGRRPEEILWDPRQ